MKNILKIFKKWLIISILMPILILWLAILFNIFSFSSREVPFTWECVNHYYEIYNCEYKERKECIEHNYWKYSCNKTEEFFYTRVMFIAFWYAYRLFFIIFMIFLAFNIKSIFMYSKRYWNLINKK